MNDMVIHEMKSTQVTKIEKTPAQQLGDKCESLKEDFDVVITDFNKFCLSIDSEFSHFTKKLTQVSEAMQIVKENSSNYKKFIK